MAEALAIDLEEMRYDETQRIEDNNDIVNLCGSLVTSQEGILKLAHYSVKEYLTSNRLLSSVHSSYYIAGRDAQLCIAQSCLLYLRHVDEVQLALVDGDVHNSSTATRTPLPLYPYSINAWWYHYRELDKPKKLTTLALDILGNPSSMFAREAWCAPSFAATKLAWKWSSLIYKYGRSGGWKKIEKLIQKSVSRLWFV